MHLPLTFFNTATALAFDSNCFSYRASIFWIVLQSRLIPATAYFLAEGAPQDVTSLVSSFSFLLPWFGLLEWFGATQISI